MGWIDVAILGMVGISALIGLARGFLREVVSLSSWVLAYWISTRFAEPVSRTFSQLLKSETIRLALAYAILFIGVLILGAIVNYLVHRFVHATGFTGTDRALGLFFGLLRGGAILILFVLVAGMTTMPRQGWWRDSLFLQQIQPAANWVRGQLPRGLARHINLSSPPPQVRS